MTEQHDYGKASDPERALVPGALVAYRHFQLDLKYGRLLPMNVRPSKQTALQDAYRPADIGGYWDEEAGFSINPPLHEAICNRFNRPYVMFPGEQERPPHGKAPVKNCSCGFYASYDPATDFYPSFTWGKEYAEEVGSEEFASVVIVRAAVELTGRVVMGTKGVRAEKMKILGLAIDWSKYVRPRPARYADQFYYIPGKPLGGGWLGPYDRFDVERNVGRPGLLPETESHVQSIAIMYGARYFAEVNRMYDAHPKADLAALGVTEEPDNPYDSGGWMFGVNRMAAKQAQAAAYVPPAPKPKPQAGIKGFSMTLAIKDEMTKFLADAFDIPADVIDSKPETAKERALRLKRERPAPPGTGIDRRRGKLR